jgi:hypothetical protein
MIPRRNENAQRGGTFVEIGEIYYVRVGAQKSLKILLDTVDGIFKLEQDTRQRVRADEVWHVKVVMFSEIPKVILVKPIRKIPEEEFVRIAMQFQETKKKS